MLSPKPQLSLRNAREYFREHLSSGDYYSADAQVAGEWFGLGTEKLGLSGHVKESDFLALCDGKHPTTGRRLTARANANRRTEDGRMVANRRVFYDFTISPPKSVSVVALMQDDRIVGLHDRAVRLAMSELEKFAQTRVRKRGQHGDRETGNIVAAAFRHDTSRELDPHLHTHCVVLNATFDQDESRWKALEVSGMYRAQKFAENLYYHELCRGLRRLGYEIESNHRDFEIRGVPPSVIERFSKRHQQIDQGAAARLNDGNGLQDANAVRRQVAHDHRRRKMKESTAERLRPEWRSQLKRDEARKLATLTSDRTQPTTGRSDAAAAVSWADELLFDRRSVVHDHELMAAALARCRGENLNLEVLRGEIEQRGYIREVGTHKLTSREVMSWELGVVVAAHDGRRRHARLNPDYRPSSQLTDEQKNAVDRILNSRDFVTLFRGGAGTGKSFTLKEVERGLRAAEHPVVVLAPQRQQVNDLKRDGLGADTVSKFLLGAEHPKGAVVMVDEAGQIGGKQLGQLIEIVHAAGGRLILSGDTRQHGAVAASDALRAIERHSGLKPAIIRQIRRQDPKRASSVAERDFVRRYRNAVRSAATGDIVGSFEQLDQLGCVRELGPKERLAELTAEYEAGALRNEKVLVVAQTREEARRVNEAIRERLRVSGKLGASRNLATFRPLDLNDAQKRDPRWMRSGQFVSFLQRYGRFAKGDVCEIAGATEHGVVLIKDGRRSTMSYRYADRLVVAERSDSEIAVGDRLQLKFNGTSVEGRPLNNGELVKVIGFRRGGGIKIEDDARVQKTLAPSQRLFVRGFAVTSYGSQGKTVDTVLCADAANRAATDAKQWYVTISRGRKRVLVFTSDKEALRANIQSVGERELALDLEVDDRSGAMIHRPVWFRRMVAAVERTRRHNDVMQRMRTSAHQQRIAV